MDEKVLAEYIKRLAKREMFNGKGRIIIEEFQRDVKGEFGEVVSVQDLFNAWRKVYPTVPIEQKMNVLIIIFDSSFKPKFTLTKSKQSQKVT